MNNRTFFKKSMALFLCAIMLLCMIPASASAATVKPKTLPLATVSDLHFYPSSLAGHKGEAYYSYIEGSNAQPDDVNNIIDATLASLKTEQANKGLKYVVLCGDLTVNGEYEGNRVLANKLLKFEKETGLKVFVTNGNHDINNPDAADFTTDRKQPARITTPSDFYKLYKDLGFSDAYHTYKTLGNGTQGSLSYSVKLDEGYRLIMADGGKYTADATKKGLDEKETGGAYSVAQLKWILAEIEDAKSNGEIPLLFTHWNFSGMNHFHDKLLQGFVIDDAYKLQEAVADAGCHYVFSGHQHQSDINVTYSDKGEALYSIITPSVSQFPFAYRMTTFTPKSDGSISAKFEQRECDEYSPVKASAGTYPSPYRQIGFVKQYGGNSTAEGYIMYMVKGFLSGIFADIRAEGSIIKYIEKKMEIDLEEKIDDLLSNINSFPNVNLKPGKHIMSFLDDLDVQLMEKYIYNLPYTYSVLESAIKNVCDTEVSKVPCTKYISEYGFGDPTKGGTVGDLLLDILATMYRGNEDISDDAFLKDVIKQCSKTEFVDLVFNTVKKSVVEDVLVDEILASTDIHLDTFFLTTKDNIGGYIQIFYNMMLALLGSGIFNTDERSFSSVISNILTKWEDISIKKLVETVLATDLISYGNTVDSLLDGIIANFIGEPEKKAAAYQLSVLIDGIAHDDSKDYDVTYTYAGPVKITPTKEAMQLPSNIQVSVTSDSATSFTVTWFTKYSVTGTDIEVVKSGSSFTGKARTEKVIISTTKTTFGGYGFDFGSFGILPWEKDVVRHAVTVTGLKSGTKYKFRIGDFKKGFTCDGTYTTSSADGRDMTFINLTDSDATCPADYKNINNIMKAAKNTYGDIAFALHSGNIVKKSDNDMQWTWALDGNNYASKIPLMYTAGSNDSDETYAAAKHFTHPASSCKYTECGTYYSFNYGDVHVAVINTNYLNDDGSLSSSQYNWLYKDLQSNEAKWTVLSLHSSTATDAKKAAALKTQLLGIMKKFNVDLILQGGANAYVRTELLRNDVVMRDARTKEIFDNEIQYLTYLENDGTITAISGCASGSYAPKAPIDKRYAKSLKLDAPSFSAITVKDDTLLFTAYTVNSKGEATIIDTFGMRKTDSRIKLGDVDLDGQITPADSRLVLRMTVGLDFPTERQKLAADVDTIDGIQTSDARKILRVAVGYEKFPIEYVTKTEY